jgi:hypothetical protein
MRTLKLASEQPVLVVLLVGCMSLVAVTLVLVYKGDLMTGKWNPVANLDYCGVPQSISEEDHKFLDDLVQQQSQDKRSEPNPVSERRQNLAGADSDSTPVPRAELVVNNSEVKRAQLVVNGRIVERAELVRTRRQ